MTLRMIIGVYISLFSLTHSGRRAIKKITRSRHACAQLLRADGEFWRVRVELPRAFLPATYHLLTTENGGYLHEVEDKASRVPLKVCFL